jgi:hypothetical protein
VTNLALTGWGCYTVLSPIDKGGLGIRNVKRFNQALLGKWLWRFAHEDGAWWRSVLVVK